MAAVMLLTQEARLEHFVKRISDWKEVWSLRGSHGWVASETNDGKMVVPFWPHPHYATQCAAGEWSDTTPAVIKLEAFVEAWLPGLEGDQRLVEVFKTPNQNGGVIAPSSLRELLAAECRETYGDGS